MTTRTRKTAAKPKAARPAQPPTAAEPVVDEQARPVEAAAEERDAETAPESPPENLEVSPPRRPDSRVEVVAVGECIVDGCPVLEFEPGRGLCMGHFTTRLDLREAARHD